MFRLSMTGAIVLLLTAPGPASPAQTTPPERAVPIGSVLTDTALGISFRSVGPCIRERGSYRMRVEESTGLLRSATVTISASPRPSVDLPGSYGGTLYLDKPHPPSFMKNRVQTDTVVIGGSAFRRDIWAVYAGMGAWEGVVNCYAFRNGGYCTISLRSDLMLGKPGEVIGGEQVSGGALRKRLAAAMQDTTESAVRKFNAFLSSFTFSNK